MTDVLKDRIYKNDKCCDVSIIISAYNVGQHLENCINSVINQSKKNIEIICVDDCSTDNSLDIIKKMASRDKRIRIIKNLENRGLLYVRKCGVMAAEGKYVMFLDGDDSYPSDACETAYLEISQSNVDILQFDININNVGNASQFEVDSFEKFVVPYRGTISHGNVLEACFRDEKYNYNLVNKIYRATLCKKAFSKLDDQHYYMAEDMLTYFVLSYFADTYRGISNKLYNYNFAIGVSRPGRLDLDGLDKRCCGADSIAAVKRFLEQQGVFKKYESIYKKMERRILSDNFDAWYYRLPCDNREEGYTIFEGHWGKDKVILGLLYDVENKQYDINQKARMIEENNVIIEKKNYEILELGNLNQQLEKELFEKKELIRKEESQIDSLIEKNQLMQNQYNHVVHSMSYKLGWMVTWLPRKVAKWIRVVTQKG